MSEQEESAPAPDAGSVTPDDMAAALEAMRASSPEMSQALDAADISPDSLAEAHAHATEDPTGSE